MKPEIAILEHQFEQMAGTRSEHVRLAGKVPIITAEVLIRTSEGQELTESFDILSLASAVDCARRKHPSCSILTARHRVELPEDDYA